MSETEKSDQQLRWIYEGTKSLVNREDYLLGKKVDKNFELYSDAVVKEKEGGIEAVLKGRTVPSESSSSKISNLEVEIVRTEDPLVAIKLKEESIRREKIENPLTIMKMQKLLRIAMEKKERKRLKKKEKHRKRHKHSDHAPSERHEKRRHESEERKMDDSRPATSKEKHESERRSNKGQKRERKLQRDSHIPEHLRSKYSSDENDSDGSDNDVRRTSEQKYGMITKSGSERCKTSTTSVNPYETLPKKSTIIPYKKPEKRRKLTDEEIEAKRLEMMANADWRDQIRKDNIKKNARRDDAEEQSNTGKAAAFIRPMLNNAASSTTMERQLNSHRRDLQRTTTFTEQKFMRR